MTTSVQAARGQMRVTASHTRPPWSAVEKARATSQRAATGQSSAALAKEVTSSTPISPSDFRGSSGSRRG